jgi:hypothetical protein
VDPLPNTNPEAAATGFSEELLPKVNPEDFVVSVADLVPKVNPEVSAGFSVFSLPLPNLNPLPESETVLTSELPPKVNPVDDLVSVVVFVAADPKVNPEVSAAAGLSDLFSPLPNLNPVPSVCY